MSKMSIFTALAGWLPGRTATGLKQACTSNLTTSDGSLPTQVANTLQRHGWPNDLTALMQHWAGPHESFRARSLGEDRALAQELIRTLREQTPQSAASSGRRSSSAASSGAGSQQTAAAAAAAAVTATPPGSPQAMMPAAHHPLQLNPAQPSLAPAAAPDATAPVLAAPTFLPQEAAAATDSDLLQQLLDGAADGGGMFSQGRANMQQWPIQQQQVLLLPAAGDQASHPVTDPQTAATYGPVLATAASMTAPQQIPAVFSASGQLPVPAAAEPQTIATPMQGPDTTAMSAAVQNMYDPASLQAAAAAALQAASSSGPAATAAGVVVSSAATATAGRLAGSLGEFELPEEDSVLRTLLEQHLDAALGGLDTAAAGTNPSMSQQQQQQQQQLDLELQQQLDQQQQQHPADTTGLACPFLPLGEGRAVLHGKRRRMEEANISLPDAAAAAAAQGRGELPDDQAAQQALGRASSFPGARGVPTAQHSTAQDASMLAWAHLSEPEQLVAPPIMMPNQQPVTTLVQQQPTLQQMQHDVWHIYEASQPQQASGGTGQQLWQQYQTQLAGQQQQQPHPAAVAAGFAQPQLLSPQHSLETQAAWQQISGLVQRVALLEHNQQQMQQELTQLWQEMHRGSRPCR